MDTEPDPLAITPDYNLAVFGGADNIEFIVESDEDNDQDSDELETKDGIVIEIDDLEELNVEEIMARNRSSNSPRESLTEYQLIDLDEPEVKEEIEEVVDIATPNDEKECEPAVSEKLVNINQDRMKNSSCYVPGCTSEFSTFNEEKICWFTVPTDENLKKIWNICIGRVDKPLTHGDVICHKHFSEFTVPYDKPKLTRGAVPCIKFHEECCVPTCRRTIGRMYCFPVLRTSDFHLWMYMVKNPILKHLKMKEVLRHRVCDIHFDSDCFDDDFLLKKSAAPTLYVPGNYTVDLASIKSDSERAATISQNDILICAHGECPNRSNSGKKIFRFPTVASRCNAWLKACGRRNLISSPQITLRQMRRLKLGVCEDHFNFQDFKDDMQELKPDVIPKPYRELGLDFRKSKAFSTETVGKNVIPGISSALKSFGGICAYNGCQSKPSAANPFFRFPSDTERAEKWLRACGILKRKQSLTSMLICIKHFDKDMFDAFNRLKDDAIPISYNLHKQMEDEKMSTAMNNSTLAITEQQQISLHSPTAIEANTQNGKEEHCIESKPKSIIRCAVENCQHFFNAKYIRVNNHRFPDPIKDPQRFNIWLQLIANPKLKDLSKEEIYNNYLVCVRHFETYFYRQFGKGTQLSQEAIPTKNLPVDHQWFYTSEYYKTRLKSCFGNFGAKDSSEDVTMEWKEEDIQDIGECEDKTRCILEKDRIRFPGMGNYLYMGQRVNKNKVPYNVYNCLNSGYGLSRNVEIGENIRIHTAIIIDDDDDLERQVLQDLLDKRRKKS